MVDVVERRCAHCAGDMIGKRRGAIYCGRRCKTFASDGRRRDDGRAQKRDRIRYPSEADHRRGYAREQSRQLREAVLAHFGDACVACESQFHLELDHVNGNGERHRDVVGHGDAFYRYLLREDFPTDCEADGKFALQLLCRTCHVEKTNLERKERG